MSRSGGVASPRSGRGDVAAFPRAERALDRLAAAVESMSPRDDDYGVLGREILLVELAAGLRRDLGELARQRVVERIGMQAGRQPVELAPHQHRRRPGAARLGLVGDFLDLPLLQLAELLFVPARLANDRCRAGRLLRRSGSWRPRARAPCCRGSTSMPRSAPSVSILRKKILAGPATGAAVLQHLGGEARDAGVSPSAAVPVFTSTRSWTSGSVCATTTSTSRPLARSWCSILGNGVSRGGPDSGGASRVGSRPVPCPASRERESARWSDAAARRGRHPAGQCGDERANETSARFTVPPSCDGACACRPSISLPCAALRRLGGDGSCRGAGFCGAAAARRGARARRFAAVDHAGRADLDERAPRRDDVLREDALDVVAWSPAK